MLREVFSRDLQGATGEPYTRSRYYHLYLNGQYWGIYQSQERTDAAYSESYFGGQRSDYDVIKVDPKAGYTIEATDGNLDAWQQLWNQAQAGFATDAAYCRAQGLNPDGTRNPAYPVLPDVENMIDYMLVVLYSGNSDGPISATGGNVDPNNWYGVRSRTGQEGFQFFAYEAEKSLSLGEANRNGPYSAGNQFLKSNPQWLHQRLMANAEYRLRFADHAQEYLFDDGLLTPSATAARFNARANELSPAVVAESARWGDAQRAAPYTKTDWQNAVNNELTSFFPTRSQTLVNQLKATVLPPELGGASAPLYPAIAAPGFSQHGGQVAEGYFLWLSAPSGTIYYTLDGSDPRLAGGAVAPGAQQFGASPIVVSESTLVRARVKVGAEWSAVSTAQFYVGQAAVAGKLAVTEINYNPYEPTQAELAINPLFDKDDFEFIELQNIGEDTIDLTGVRFTDGVTFDF